MARAISLKNGESKKAAVVAPMKTMKKGGCVGTGGMKSPNGVAKGMKFVNQ